MSEFLYVVGDEYEGSPILQSKFISEVLAVGGLVEIEGNIVRIIYLPASVHGEVQVADKYADEIPKPVEKLEEVVEKLEDVDVVPEAEEPVAEKVEEATQVVQEAVDVAVETEAIVAPKPKGRPRKTASSEEV